MRIPEIEITVKYKGTKKADLKQIANSRDVYEVCKVLFNESTIDWTEEVILLCLSNAKKVLGYYKVSSGGVSGTVLDPRVIFTTALNCVGTTSIILAHNHPSGNLMPSHADNEITKRVYDFGQLIDITLLDHIIVTNDGYYSYLDEGKL